jgi:hypothetical protein
MGHPTSRLLVLLLATVIISASLPEAGVAQVGSVPRDDPRFGAVQAIASPDKAVQAGVRWERIIFPWAQMQPNSANEMLPGYFTDAQIDGEVKRGITLVGVVLYTPGWAATDPSLGGAAVPKGLDRPVSDPNNTWARFIGRLAAKYKGKVDSWIVWNEPDLIDKDTKFQHNWAGSEADFWQLQKSAYLAIKQANPQAQVLLSGFSFWHAKEAGLEPYLKRLLDIGAKDSSAPKNNWYFDGVPLHPYANPLNSFALPEIIRGILDERGLKKEIWNVESNAVPWDDPVGLLSREPWRVTMDEQTSYIIQMLALSLAADVDRVSVYKMRDESPENGQNFGLVREDGTTRPAYTALQTAVTYFSGAKGATYTWNGSGNPPSSREVKAILDSRNDHYQFIWPGQINQVALERDGERITVVWNVTRRPLTALVAAGSGQATLVDTLGRTSEITAQDGLYQVYLDAARTDTDPRDASLTLVGGHPWLIVESLGNNPRPSQPPKVADGLFFKESGFAVANPKFADFYKLHGGKDTFGYPISREFDLLGAPAQIFQRHILQVTPDGGVQALNLLDEGLLPYTRINNSVFPGPDPNVKSRAPSPADPAYASKIVRFVEEQAPNTWQGQPVNFGQTFANTVTCAEAFGDGDCQSDLLALLNLEIWGAPISAPAADPGNSSFIYQRFQRGIMHYDAACRCTQGLLFGEYLKAIITGQGLPPDLDEQAKGSPYYRQYDQARVHGLTRPLDLPRSNFKDAFEKLP